MLEARAARLRRAPEITGDASARSDSRVVHAPNTHEFLARVS
ncbi:Hypothetical protein A7982_05655 [Minicystis rosea]|nr:Hypothetical protein A7982_05655 [Minicystis rosea]